jgi:glycolate oxidase
LPIPGGVVIALSRLNRVLDVDIPNRRVTVEPGVTNLEITRQVASHGFYYAPDPSSQQVCSIGGNVAENSGGAHCLKYGFTVHHVLGLEAVLPNGDLVRLDSAIADAPGPDLVGVLIGSEGTLAVVTKVIVRILRRPRASRRCLRLRLDQRSGLAVSEIIAAGIIPAAVEIMDSLSIVAVEPPCIRIFRRRFDPDRRARWSRRRGPRAVRGGRGHLPSAGATTVEVAQDEAHRARIWKGRKGAFASMGVSRRTTTCRTAWCRVRSCRRCSSRIRQLEARCGLRIGNVFHAGDGNLHPLICYDEKIPVNPPSPRKWAREILSYCVEAAVRSPANTA